MTSRPEDGRRAESLQSSAEQQYDITASQQTLRVTDSDGRVISEQAPGKDLDQYHVKDVELREEQGSPGLSRVGLEHGIQVNTQETPGNIPQDVAAQLQTNLGQYDSTNPPGNEGISDQPLIPSVPINPFQQQAGVTIHIAPAMAPDYDIDDEGYAESTTTSYVTSIASEISRGILENDRIYPHYGGHDYGMPVDEEEMDRMDLQHRKYEMVLGDKHFLAPIGDSPQKILDLGTGTGTWALDVADMFPTASVVGVDIAPIQPKWVAPNCQFEIDDVEALWTWKPNSFDFIHLRDPLLMIHDWPKLMHQVYDHLRPGGWCELACIYPQPTSDDGSMPPDSGFKLICDKLVEASQLFGSPCDNPPQYQQFLRGAGFIDVTENTFKIPSSPWPKDPRLKKIGALEMMNVIAGATAFGLRAFEQVFGWSKLQTEVAMIDFKRDVKNRKYHQYCK